MTDRDKAELAYVIERYFAVPEGIPGSTNRIADVGLAIERAGHGDSILSRCQRIQERMEVEPCGLVLDVPYTISVS